MVVVKFNLVKRDFLWMGFIVILLGIGFGYAYGGNNPVVMGHSAGEIEVDDAFCNQIMGHDCGHDDVMGHSAGEIEVSWDDIADIPIGFNDGIDDVGSASSDQIIWFGNVGVPLQDGASAGGDDNGYTTGSTCVATPASQAKVEDGKVYTRVYFPPATSSCNQYCDCCDTGWVEGTSASCSCFYGSVHCHNSATTTRDGVNEHSWA